MDDTVLVFYAGATWLLIAMFIAIELTKDVRSSIWSIFVCIVISLLWSVATPLALFAGAIEMVMKKVKNNDTRI